VLVAEDSATARELLVQVLASDPEIEVVGQAHTGVQAVDLTLALRPDLVTMDIEMPGLDGIAATREIMERVPTPIIVVSTSTIRRDAVRSMDALAAGALYVIGKPQYPFAEGFERWRDELLSATKSMAQVEVVRRVRRRPGARTPVSAPAALGGRTLASPGSVATPPAPGTAPRLIAIAASTGGPSALHLILRALPPNFPLPIVVVQHIAHGFTGALAGWLQQGCRVRVRVAEDGEALCGGVVYLAPDDRHLGVTDRRVALSDDAKIGAFRPSANHLFESAAREYGASVVGVILTGMGTDGVAGLRHVRAAGGRVLAQDEESSVVFGMPAGAIRAGLTDAVLNPQRIADHLTALARSRP
jgi:two-component system chemotaxis response regulator CheB